MEKKCVYLSVESKKNEWGWKPLLLVLITLSWTFYDFNIILNYVITIIYVFGLIYFIFTKQLELLYFPLIFFDTVLVLPIGGSFFRIYEIAFLIHLIINRKLRIPKNNIAVIILVCCFMSLFYTESISNTLSTIINAFIMYIIIVDLIKLRSNREHFLIILSIGAAVSGIYGFFHGEGINYGYGIRYSGSIADPNYSALFYLYGIIAIFCANFIKKRYKILILVVLLISLLRTISLTGIIGGILLLLLLQYIKTPKKGMLLIIVGTVLFLIFITIRVSPDSLLYGIHTRLIDTIASLRIGNYDMLTSSRSSLFDIYFTNFVECNNIFLILFGGYNILANPLFGSVSHNSYIDILYMNGIVGLIIILGFFGVRIIQLIKKYKITMDESLLGIAFIKITTLYFAMTISIYSFRYFNMAFWL